jgi:hypothetical protein
MRGLADAVTAAEVEAQQARDQAAEAEGELGVLADRLGLEALPAQEEVPASELAALRDRVERLARRREALGPVNPLAAEEYREALERVEELEASAQRPGERAAGAAGPDPQHGPRDRRELPADLHSGRRQLRGAGRRRLPRRARAPAPGA